MEDFQTFHLHNLTPAKINDQKKVFDDCPKNMYQHIKTAIYLQDNNVLETEEIKVINLVRDPISRSLSHFFQNYYGPNTNAARDLLKKLRIEKSAELFQSIYDVFLSSSQHSEPFDWTNSELAYIFKSDPYQYSFNKKKGYGLVTNKNISILTIQNEISDNRKVKYINQFLGTNIKQLIKSNVTEDKDIGSIYKQIKLNMKLSKKFKDQMYESKYCKYYYTDKQIQKFQENWSDQI